MRIVRVRLGLGSSRSPSPWRSRPQRLRRRRVGEIRRRSGGLPARVLEGFGGARRAFARRRDGRVPPARRDGDGGAPGGERSWDRPYALGARRRNRREFLERLRAAEADRVASRIGRRSEARRDGAGGVRAADDALFHEMRGPQDRPRAARRSARASPTPTRRRSAPDQREASSHSASNWQARAALRAERRGHLPGDAVHRWSRRAARDRARCRRRREPGGRRRRCRPTRSSGTRARKLLDRCTPGKRPS